jgi:hypothetical protein
MMQLPQTDSGAAIPVELMAADAVGKGANISVMRTTIDAAGRFEFTEVPPGRYVVGVDLVRRMDARVVFPTTFYPGTADPASATVVQLTGGQERELDPMLLPRSRTRYQLAGTVVFEDGSRAAGAFVSLSDGGATFLPRRMTIDRVIIERRGRGLPMGRVIVGIANSAPGTILTIEAGAHPGALIVSVGLVVAVASGAGMVAGTTAAIVVGAALAILEAIRWSNALPAVAADGEWLASQLRSEAVT